MVRALLLLSLLLFSNSCFAVSKIKTFSSPYSNCFTTNHLEYESRESGVYSDAITGNSYKVTIDSQLNLSIDYISEKTKLPVYFYTSEEIGLIANTLVSNSKNYFNDSQVERIKNSLTNIHVVIAKDKKAFDQIWLKPNDKKRYHAKMALKNSVCFDLPKESDFSAVFMPNSFLRNKPEFVIHEFLHMISFQVYGHVDLEHKNKLLWSKDQVGPSGQESLLNTTKKIFENL
jgi:hypothetical protein